MTRRRRIRRWLKRLAVATTTAVVVGGLTLAVVWHVFGFPFDRLDDWPTGPVITDRNGEVMLRRVGSDDQWRSPVSLDEISPWLVQATVAVEDERFFSHCGVDPIAVGRASLQNVAARRVVSGASTLSMQVCRMTDDRPRTFRAKSIEAFRALQLEAERDKTAIIETYLNVAPYGGNVRGVEAASLRYFGKHAADLSLGEAALLTGLPQSPSRHRPDRHLASALQRRKTVLRRMVEEGFITEQERQFVEAEPVAVSSNSLSAIGPHAAWWALSRRPDGGRTTIDLAIQRQVERLAGEHAQRQPEGTEVAAVVIEIASGDIVAMVGSTDATDPVDGQVNGALAWRSPGSALKPFVYAAAFEAKRLAHDSIVHDVPISRGAWSPSNFDRTFSGPVTVRQALQRSLNVPAILVAEGVGLDRCVGVIEAAGVRLSADAVRRGGLATVVGSIEVRLLDLVNAYATIGRGGVRKRARLFPDEPAEPVDVLGSDVCATLDWMLSSHARPPNGMAELAPRNVPWFMWKTGTSSGRRDAWAAGHNRSYAIGVWVGRFSGVGGCEYVGSRVAEPLLAQLFNLPDLRRSDAPPTPDGWEVTRPLPPPKEASAKLCILWPTANATFIATDGAAIVHPSANRKTNVQWFLDGTLLDRDQSPRLSLTPGRYDLRCAGVVGDWSAVRFVVR